MSPSRSRVVKRCTSVDALAKFTPTSPREEIVTNSDLLKQNRCLFTDPRIQITDMSGLIEQTLVIVLSMKID